MTAYRHSPWAARLPGNLQPFFRFVGQDSRQVVAHPPAPLVL